MLLNELVPVSVAQHSKVVFNLLLLLLNPLRNQYFLAHHFADVLVVQFERILVVRSLLLLNHGELLHDGFVGQALELV